MKIKTKAKDCQLWVKVKTSSSEMLNEKELDRFSRAYLRGFLKPKLIKKNLIEYTGPIGISLCDRFKKPLNKRDFLFILEQIVVAVQKLQANNMFINSMVTDLQYVYINEVTKEVQFIYIPTANGIPNFNLLKFIETIVYSVKPADEKDNDFVSRFIYFFKAMKPFDISKIELFVVKEDKSVVNTIKKQNAGQSGFMTNKQQHYYEHYDNNKSASVDEDATGLINETSNNFAPVTTNATSFVEVDEEATGLIGEDPINFAPVTTNATSFVEVDEEATGLLGENPVNFAPAAANVASFVETDEEATGLLFDEDGGNEEATGLLVENDVNVRFPTLLRVLTGETVSINKPVFRIGKEKSYVDYFVNNNIAVSRSHADIITRGNKYYAKDLNSTNHTYINNQKLPIHMEVELLDGDRLKLGNEEFVFNM